MLYIEIYYTFQYIIHCRFNISCQMRRLKSHTINMEVINGFIYTIFKNVKYIIKIKCLGTYNTYFEKLCHHFFNVYRLKMFIFSQDVNPALFFRI